MRIGSVKKRGLIGNTVIQRGVLAALGRPDRSVQAAADADFCKGTKGGVSLRGKAPDGGKQAQKALLNQVLAVAPRQKQRAGTGSDQPAIAAHQFCLCPGISPGRILT